MITAANVTNLLSSVNGVTFARINYDVEVKTAAAHKNTNITKKVVANVQLFNGIKDFSNVYEAAVKRSSGATEFVVSDTYFEHDATCYSVVRHMTNGKEYLYCIYNNAKSEYFIDGVAATVAQVAELLTPSAAKELLTPSATVQNVTNDVAHSVRVRTISLANIESITAAKQTIV